MSDLFLVIKAYCLWQNEEVMMIATLFENETCEEQLASENYIYNCTRSDWHEGGGREYFFKHTLRDFFCMNGDYIENDDWKHTKCEGL